MKYSMEVFNVAVTTDFFLFPIRYFLPFVEMETSMFLVLNT